MIPLLCIYGLIILIFIFLGFLFQRGRDASLIAGYNTMPPWKQKQYDTKKMCRFLAKIMFFMAFCFLIIALSALLDRMLFLWLGLGLFLASAIFAVIWINSGDRFKKDKRR